MADPIIGQTLGQYQVLSLLGRGGMAAVYRARQASIGRDVAIKVIKPEFAQAQDFNKRFEREARTIATLSHAHILKVFDYGKHGELIYLVMELLIGGSLAELISQGPLPVARINELLRQIASALDYAHRNGVIHRDLKPQNVLLDNDGNAFLTDFGIAKLVTSTTALTQGGSAMGTPSYMAPEQWRGEHVDGRADIYSLGVMLFEMLSGALPFEHDTPFRMMHKHIYEQPRSIYSVMSDVPSAVDRLISKALAKNPDDRFSSAGQLAAAFASAVSGETGTGPFKRGTGTLPAPPPDEPINLTLLPISGETTGETAAAEKASAARAEPTPPQVPTTPELPKAEAKVAGGGRGLLIVGALVALIVIGAVVVILSGQGGGQSGAQTQTAAALAQIPTETALPTATATNTASRTPTATSTAAPTNTPTFTPSITFTPSPNASLTAESITRTAISERATQVQQTLAAFSLTRNAPTATNSPTTTYTPSATATATSAATATYTPSVTYTPSATNTPEPPAVIANAVVPLRTGPDSIWRPVRVTVAGEKLPVVAQIGSGNTLWYLVKYNEAGDLAWIWSRYVTLIPPEAIVPSVTPTPVRR